MRSKNYDDIRPVSLTESQDALEQIVKHYLVEGKGLDNTKVKITITLSLEILLQFVCWSGAPVYAKPAAAFANGNKIKQPIYVISTCIPALAVLYITTKGFIQSIRNKIHPNNLKQYMNTLKRTETILKYFGIIIGSLLTSIPLWLTAIEYPITDIDILNNIFDTITLFDNWALHMFPVNLIFEDKNPIYRLPILPFIGAQQLYKWIQHSRMSHRQKQGLTLRAERHKNFEILKDAFINTIEHAQELIIKNDFKFDKNHLIYQMNIPNKFKNLDVSKIAVDQLVSLIKHANGYSTKLNTRYSQYTRKLANWCDWILENSFYIAGGLLSIVTFIGYSKDPLEEIPHIEPFNKMPSQVGEVFTWSSIYVFNMLFWYLTANTTVDLYKYIKSLVMKEDTNKLPLIFKLYPKSFTVCMLINAVLSPFAGSSANEMIRRNFSGKKWDPYREYLIGISAFGLAYLGFFVVRDMTKELFTIFGNLFGNNDTKGAIRLMKKLNQIKSSIRSMKGEILVTCLNSRPHQRRVLLNEIGDEKYKELTFFNTNEESGLLNTEKILVIQKDDSEVHADFAG